MLLSLCRCQLKHIHHASINIETSILGVRRWHYIWRIRWSPTMYWIRLWLWCCVLWRYERLLKNQGQVRCINGWIIIWRRHRYHPWWKLITLLVPVLAIKAPVTTSVVTTNALWKWHDECYMSMWWCCVNVILLVDSQQKVRANFFARQLHFSTSNKIDYELFISI